MKRLIMTVLIALMFAALAYAQELNFKDEQGRYMTDKVKVKEDYSTFFSQKEAASFKNEEEAEKALTDLGFKIYTAEEAKRVGWLYWNELIFGYVWKIKLLPSARLAIKGEEVYLLECKIKYSSGVIKYRPNRLKIIEKVDIPVAIVEDTEPVKEKCKNCPPKEEVTRVQKKVSISCPIWGDEKLGASKGRKVNQLGVHAGLYGAGGSIAAGSVTSAIFKDNPAYGKAALYNGLAGAGASIFLQLITQPKDQNGKRQFFGVDMLTVRSSIGKMSIKPGEVKHFGQYGTLAWQGDTVTFFPADIYAENDLDCSMQWQVQQSKNNNWFIVPVPYGNNFAKGSRTLPVKTTAGKSPDRTGEIPPTNGYVAPRRSVTGDIPPAIVQVKTVNAGQTLQQNGDRRINW